MKHTPFLIWLLLAAATARLPAQTLERPTFSNGGNADVGLTFTVGETPTATPVGGIGSPTLSVGAQPGDAAGTVGTGEAGRLQGVAVFPNPTEALLQVERQDPALGAIQARLFDTNGRLLLTRDCPDVRSTLDLQTLPAGTYTLLLQAAGKSQGFQIVKIR